LRVVVVFFLVQGDALALACGALLLAAVWVAPLVGGGVLAGAVRLPTELPAALVVAPLGFSDELSLVVGDGDTDPLWLGDVVGVELSWIWPTEDDGVAAGVELLQSRGFAAALETPELLTGLWLCELAVPSPLRPPPPAPVLTPAVRGELALLGKIACCALMAT